MSGITIPTPRLSKKLSFALVTVACGTALAWHGTIDAGQWLELVKWLGVTYVGSQAAVDGLAALRHPPPKP